MRQSGVHIAFAAGTGALCFVDLVAHLIHSAAELRDYNRSSVNNDKMLAESCDVNMDSIQFHLYVSFPRRSEAVALELFEALDEYCKRHGKDHFSLHLRLSQEKINPGRWDEAFIRQEIGKFPKKDIQRVWVCGPPVMNETFDRVFSAQSEQGQNQVSQDEGPLLGQDSQTLLTKEQYEIL